MMSQCCPELINESVGHITLQVEIKLIPVEIKSLIFLEELQKQHDKVSINNIYVVLTGFLKP